MSNNSMVCAAADGATDGAAAEIGRAQWVQALAARVTPEPAMNPVLLKPGSDRRSHVVLMGRPGGAVDAGDMEKGRPRAAHAAFDDLAARYNVIVAEGAGSPAEINLRAGDYVNMGLARHAGLPAVIVGDIDRGGVFAALFGTVALLEPADQALVTGFVVNKFRGDRGLLAPGLTMIERMTGRRVYGVLPWHPACGPTRRTPSTWRAAGGPAARAAGRGRPAAKDQQLHGPRRARPRARARCRLRVRAARCHRRRPDRPAGHPRHHRRPGLAPRPRTRPRYCRARTARQAGARHLRRMPCSATPSSIPTALRACQSKGRWARPARPSYHLSRREDAAPARAVRLRDPPRMHRGRDPQRRRDGHDGARQPRGHRARAAYLAETLGVASAASFPAARERRLDLLGDMVEEHLNVGALLKLPKTGAGACPTCHQQATKRQAASKRLRRPQPAGSRPPAHGRPSAPG